MSELYPNKQHNVFAAEGNTSALVVADTLRMASSGSSKKGEIQGLLASPLDPPVAGGGGGGRVVGAFTCYVLINYLAKTPIIPNNNT